MLLAQNMLGKWAFMLWCHGWNWSHIKPRGWMYYYPDRTVQSLDRWWCLYWFSTVSVIKLLITEQFDAEGTGNMAVRVTMWHSGSGEYPICWAHKLRWLRDQACTKTENSRWGQGPTEELMPRCKGGGWHSTPDSWSLPYKEICELCNHRQV